MRTWLITGCSTGIGRAIADAVLASGDQAVVTARKPADIADFAERYPQSALTVALDVSNDASVAAAFAAAEARFGGVDVLVNNAGYGYVASIEEGDLDQVRAMFETNFWGAIRTTRTALPGMRAKRQGRIINISSIAGRIANPATGYYSTSKYALEAMTSALAREVADFGIRVTAVAAGQYRTDFSGRSLKAADGPIGDYDAGVHARIGLVKSVDGKQPGDPAKLALAMLKLADMPDPPIHLVMGPDGYAAVKGRTEEMLASMEQHKDLTISTNFDA
ncbi:short-chain dehydrogenase/reductase [Sphingomonas sp. DBB INV C78]|uniref:oxidoreductase n=1 Tax=Sphingomonas sp. DBB INV C78 TaxID=3349434 RepID=UPI0036D20AA8